MSDLGNLVDLYNQGTQYTNQIKELTTLEKIGVIFTMVVVPAYLWYYHLKGFPNAFRQRSRDLLERLRVPEVLNIPTSQIPNPIMKEDVVRYISSGGKEGHISRRFTIDDRTRIGEYAKRVKSGENALSILQEALRDEAIQELFRKRYGVRDFFFKEIRQP